MDTRALPLPGRHNRGNLCAALAAIEALGLDAAALAPHAATFRPLPHRLQTLGTRDGIDLRQRLDQHHAAREPRRARLLPRPPRRDPGRRPRSRPATGADFAERDAHARAGGGHHDGPERAAHPRAAASRSPRDAGFALREAARSGGRDARRPRGCSAARAWCCCRRARPASALPDYVERGRHFAELAGFDPDAISAIPGLGIA